MAARQKVYEAIDSEREYQKGQMASMHWNRPSESAADFLVDLRVYLRKAEDAYVQSGDERVAANEFRKLAAICVAAMEELGAPRRVEWLPARTS